MRKICFVTGTRAEYGLLSPLMRLVGQSDSTQLQIVATNMHLLPEYGETYREIESDGFSVDVKVPMHRSSDDALGIVTSMSEEILGMGHAYEELKPDMVVLLGDRYEILVAAEVALIYRIPVAHIHGGEITEGAFDDAIRHAVTKMSALHFTSTEEYRKRVIQMGEQPDKVFNVGSLGVENIKSVKLVKKDELERLLDFRISDKTILVTYHPETLGNISAKDSIESLLSALDSIQDLNIIFTMPNSDTGRDDIAESIKNYVEKHPDRSRAFKSLGLRRYLSALNYVKAVVGNSSSGIIEVPSMGIPTLNIGDRQKGRTHGSSVYDCGSDATSIAEGLRIVLSDKFRQVARAAVNPYEKENTAENIFKVISSYPLDKLRHKSFYDIK